MEVIIFFGIAMGILLILNHFEEKSKKKREEENEIFLAKQSRETIERNHKIIYDALFSFAVENKKLNKDKYDIEEGGQYVWEYKSTDVNYINTIINEEFCESSIYKTGMVNMQSLDLSKAKERIMNEMPRTKGDSYFG